LLQQPNLRLNSTQVSAFKTNLMEILTKKFQGHWYPNDTRKGEGYRAIFLSMQAQCEFFFFFLDFHLFSNFFFQSQILTI